MALGLRSARPKIPTEYASPARAELGLRIAERAAAADTLARIQDATGWSMSAPRREAERKVAVAETALGDAQKAAGASLAASVVSGEDVTPPSLIEARATLAAARDSLAAAQSAEAHLANQLPGAELALRKAEHRVRQAAAAVVREHPALNGLMAKVEKSQRELLSHGGILEALIDANVFPRDDETGHRLRTPEAEQYEAARFRMSVLDTWKFQVGYLQGVPHGVLPENLGGRLKQGVPHGVLPENLGGRLKQGAAAPWLDALDALQRDASAPLPELAP